MDSLQGFMRLLMWLERVSAAIGDEYRRRLEATPGVALVSLLSACREVAPAADPLEESDARFNRLVPPREFVPLFVLNGGSVA